MNQSIIKQVWRDYGKALDFKGSRNSLNDLFEAYKQIKAQKIIIIPTRSIRIKGKTKQDMADLIERLCMLGEVFDPFLDSEKRGLFIQAI